MVSDQKRAAAREMMSTFKARGVHAAKQPNAATHQRDKAHIDCGIQHLYTLHLTAIR
ncbi:MAG: hypothetical protein NVS3B20_02730 [Polyangiales bacterium]